MQLYASSWIHERKENRLNVSVSLYSSSFLFSLMFASHGTSDILEQNLMKHLFTPSLTPRKFHQVSLWFFKLYLKRVRCYFRGSEEISDMLLWSVIRKKWRVSLLGMTETWYVSDRPHDTSLNEPQMSSDPLTIKGTAWWDQIEFVLGSLTARLASFLTTLNPLTCSSTH